jgi:hypothetical protein
MLWDLSHKNFLGALGFLFLLSCSRTGFEPTPCDGGIDVHGICHPLECADRHCPKDFVCRDGGCVEITCFDVGCETDEACVNGECYPKTCSTKNCPGWGEVCLSEECVPGTCFGVECPSEQRCANGYCYPVDCETQPCLGEEEVCIEGQCEQRSCVGSNCPQGQRCAQGYCYPKDCAEPCGEQEVCVDGTCMSTRCVRVQCPGSKRCVDGECQDEECIGNDGAFCEDGLFCTDPDTCASGTCGGPARNCADVDPLTTDRCNELQDVCEHLVGCPMGDGTFGGKVDYPTGTWPLFATTGDFNSDGILDLVVTNTNSNSISILLGNGGSGRGDGTFATKVDYPAGGAPWSVTTDDFNADSILDLAVANGNSDNVSIFLGNGSGGRGDGTFATRVNYPAGRSSKSVTTGDFNSDSILDLAVANERSNNVSVLLGRGSGGRGDGTFAAKVDYGVGVLPYTVMAGDFNADSILDLAVANSGVTCSVSVLLGNGSQGRGDGTFMTAVDYPTGSGPNSVAKGDFNADGILDLVVANWDSNNISVILGLGSGGQGDGTFAVKVDYPAGTWPRSVTTGDFNSDSILDLAVANEVTNNVSVLLGNGDGGKGNGMFAPKVDYVAGTSPHLVKAGDLNADSILDLVVVNSDSNNVSILLGNGSGGLGNGTFATGVDYPTGSTPRVLVTGDFNADSILDMAVTNYFSNTVSVFLGNGSGGRGDGTFAPKVDYPTTISFTRQLMVGDFNADSILDLAVGGAGGTDTFVSIYLGNGSGGRGNGTFGAKVDYPTGGPSSWIIAGDFNADGILDLVMSHWVESYFSVLLGNGSGGKGDGTFAANVDYPTANSSATHLTTGDFNSDRILDLALVGWSPNSLRVYLGNGSGGRGDGTFASGVDFPTGSNPEFVTPGDFNADGILDLAVANSASNSISVFLGNGSGGKGDGTFAAKVDYPVGMLPYSVTVGDFNADSIPDLVVANMDSNNLSVLLGNGSSGRGDGTFGAAVNIVVGTQPISVAAEDFNDDGMLDLAVVNYGSNTIRVLLGMGVCQ